MACDEFEISIDMRLHGALPAERQAYLDEHLARCESCRRFEAAATATTQWMHRDVPPAVISDRYTALRARGERLARRYRWALTASVAWVIAVPLEYGWLRGSQALVKNALTIGLLTLGVSAAWAFGVWVRSRPFSEVLRVVQSSDDFFVGYRRELERQLRWIRHRALVSTLAAGVLLLLWLTNQFGSLSRGGVVLFGLLALAAIGQAWYELAIAAPRLRRELVELS